MESTDPHPKKIEGIKQSKKRETNAVSITWLGTAGVLISDNQTGILIDPYVSRCGILKIAMGLPLQSDKEAIKKWVARLGKNHIQAIAVSHSHFDHCLDAPYFALETGAPLMGSESTLNVGRGASLVEAQLEAVKPDREITVGEFKLKFIESIHGPVFLGRVPYPGTIDKPLFPPRPAGDYKLGQTYAILISHPYGTIAHHGSAGFIPGMYEGVTSDVVLLGIAGRGDTETYLKNVPLKLGAKLVIPIHFDNFFVPLEKKMRILLTAHFKEFLAVANRHCAFFELQILPIGKKVAILSEKKN
ncbi:MAG: MBL fold metallo-hydrolase [Deltaproteobacteria bacterium]|nr:MBL fold metallo-hydrolase [Deltaproteobacteria bacterium]